MQCFASPTGQVASEIAPGINQGTVLIFNISSATYLAGDANIASPMFVIKSNKLANKSERE